MVKIYRKKPVLIEAVRISEKNEKEIKDFTNGLAVACKENEQIIYKIATLEGVMQADMGDYIIKGVNGEFYPCKPDIFAKTYECV